jgi:type VI secretion system protein ImpL
MGFLTAFLRPKVWIPSAGAAFTATTLIMFSMLGWSLLIALLIVLVVALIAVVFLLLRQLRAAKASDEIETTITRQADRDIERSVPGQVAEVETMKADLLSALDTLKKSKFARKGGAAALAKLPWYMLVGPSESGKSTLVARSDLHFALTDDRQAPKSVRGVGGTRSFQWWLSEEAVLLDMPGRRLTTADFEDNDDWFAFLATLRKQRKQKPINGVIVTVGLDQIGSRNDAEVDELGRRVRARVQELVEHLGVVFPVYVVLTRADRIAGFAEHFSDLAANDRRQPWGATIPVERARSGSAEALFDAEFDTLLGVLAERRLQRLADVPDATQRARAFAFPLQLERLRPGLRRFMRALFQPDPTKEAPLFRGFYLTSTEQGGAAFDKVLRPTAQALGLSLDEPPAPPLGEGSSFASDLFERVVFPDAALAAASTQEEARRRRTRVALFVGLGVVCLTLAVMLTVLAWVNGRVVSRTHAAAVRVNEQVSPDRRLMTNLELLDALRANATIVDSLSRHKPLWRRIGAYSGDRLREPAVSLTVDRAMSTVIARALRNLKSRLVRQTQTGEGEFLGYYHDYRVWRLLTDVEHFLPEDAPLAAEVVTDVLRDDVAGETAAAQERFPALVSRLVAFLAAHREEMSARRNLDYMGGDPALEDLAAQRIRSTWAPAQLYGRMVREASAGGQPVTLDQLAGESISLKSGYAVPVAFTREGWEKRVRPRIEAVRSHVERDWLLHTVFQDTLPKLADHMLELYAQDYTAQWNRFLAEVRAEKPGNNREAASRFKALAQDGSPLFKLLGGVARETGMGEGPLQQVGRDFAILDGFESGVTDRAAGFLSRLNPLAKKGGGVKASASARTNYQALLRGMDEKVDAWAQPNSDAAAFDEAIKEASKVRGYADQLVLENGGGGAGAVARVLKMPIRVVLGGEDDVAGGGRMPEEVNRNWQLIVVQPFQKTLGGKYPIAESDREATLEEFAEFFRPGGTFWSFYDSFLKNYVTEDGSPKSQETASLVSPELKQLLEQAHAIRESFFAAGADPKLDFVVRGDQPRRDDPSLIVSWVALDVGGQHFTYEMGVRTWEEMSWPGPEPTTGAAVRANARGAVAQPRAAEGVWGLFRLLDQGQPGTSAEGNPQYTFRMPCGSSAIHATYELRGGTSRLLFRPGFLRFVPPERL